ncbi:MAG: class I SAM-dependent rRNA methyltransferase [Eubacteriales bacterium]|nr:class I SAM-dependent rRNA methyltransferase [Eubacteriales bacterium]
MADIILLPGKEKRVYAGHPWVFRSDIARSKGDPQPGDTVRVTASNGRFLAMAVYNPASQIALRVLSRRDEPIDQAFIYRRVQEAVDYRRRFADLRSCRLIFAESDGLPAVIVDSFGGVLSLQCLCLGMEKYKGMICDALMELLHPDGIYERGDVPVRELEGLPQVTGVLRGQVPDKVMIEENGVRFWVDVKNGQKTGFFLDQKENRAAIAPFVKGAEVLDCFTHTGSFALHAARFGARHVTGVDISEFACQCARENAALNGFDQVDFVAANAFDFLKEQCAAGAQYDVVILDPPAFTKTRHNLEAAERGYKEINLRGLKLLKNGGYLVTCSCSQHMLPGAFRDVVLSAAQDARVRLFQVEYRTQGRDHPILPAAPETQYLKCGIFRVDK